MLDRIADGAYAKVKDIKEFETVKYLASNKALKQTATQIFVDL